jgi:hypothetical protein
MDRLHSVLAALDASAEKAQGTEVTLRNAYHRTLNVLVRDAARRFARHADPLRAAGTPPSGRTHGAHPLWVMPDRDEVLPIAESRAQLLAATQSIRVTLVTQMMAGGLASVGMSFAVKNPLVHSLLGNLGTRITEITDKTRDEIMLSLQDSYDKGLSIPHTARALSSTVRATNINRSTLIARTEFIGAKGGGQLAAVRLTGAATYKTWLATNDGRTREDHAEADGQTVPLSAPFDVGGYAMDHPGDQNAPAEEVCNCRCTMTYGDEAG